MLYPEFQKIYRLFQEKRNNASSYTAPAFIPPAYFQKVLPTAAVLMAGIAWIEVKELKKRKGARGIRNIGFMGRLENKQ